MRSRSMTMLSFAVMISIASTACSQLPQYTYLDLIDRLTDMEALAVLPPDGEKCQQWSSYDRRSHYDAQQDKYLLWSSGGDAYGMIRYEGDLGVMAEMQGPGVIWRIWSAQPEAGHVQIYLDGSDVPVVNMPFRNYFNGSTPPFTGPLTHNAAAGWNTYVPISFTKSCKIVAQKNWGAFYHITYTMYPKGTVLPTFSMSLSPQETEALAKANSFLATERGSDPAGERPGQQQQQATAKLQPGTTSNVMEINGPRAITALHVKLDVTQGPETDELLRKLCLRITWDDEPKAAVWSPLGDFFGNALGYRPYKSLPLGMTEESFYSYWYMPFAKKAKIELINDSEKPVKVDLAVSHAPLTKPIKSLGRFHAKWHRDAFLPTDPQRLSFDWTMLKTQGRGRYVGVMLHVWNPAGGWWGEGDEKIFIDGEKFPSTFGTGSEDYFGYAWGNPALFQHAYHNQTRSQGPFACVNRWHITDNMSFQTSFEATIEKYFPNDWHVYYAATAYWYQAPGQSDGYAEAPVSERWGYFTHPPPKPPRGADYLECQKMKVVKITGGETHRQELRGWGLGRIDHLWWIKGQVGDKLTLAFPVEQEGQYQLEVQLTRAGDYAIVQLYLDGKKLGDGPIDLYDERVGLTGPLDMGTHKLTKGEHHLTAQITGANKKLFPTDYLSEVKFQGKDAYKNYMAGFDYLRLLPTSSTDSNR